MLRLLGTLGLFLGLFISASTCLASEKKPSSTISVFTQETLDNKGKSQAVGVGLLRLFTFLERETGLRFQAVPVPWNRAKALTLDGQGLIWGFSKSPERVQTYRFSEPILTSRIWAIAYGEPRLNLRKLSDLQGKIVSVERGVSHGMEFELAKNKIFTIDEDASQASARFRKLIAKRSDVLLWGLVQFQESDKFLDYLYKVYIPELRDPELLGKTFYVSSVPLFFDTIHFASAKGKYEAEMQKLDSAIKRGFKSGELQRLLAALD